MAQQINLSTPILLSQKKYFSANTMAISLGLFLLLGSVLCAAWVWNFHRGIAAMEATVGGQAKELEDLKSAIALSKTNIGPVSPALLEQLAQLRSTIGQREELLLALQDGTLRTGFGHSDRLAWVASSIPAPVWIAEVAMDGTRFDVGGFTLEPSALNDWVNKLASSPVMSGLKLGAIKVENTYRPAAERGGMAIVVAASAPTAPASATALPLEVWTFQLTTVAQPQATNAAAKESKP